MQVGMRDAKTSDNVANTGRIEDIADFLRDGLSYIQDMVRKGLIHIHEMIDMTFWNNHRMTFPDLA